MQVGRPHLNRSLRGDTGDSSVAADQSDILKRLQGGLMPTGGFQEVGGTESADYGADAAARHHIRATSPP